MACLATPVALLITVLVVGASVAWGAEGPVRELARTPWGLTYGEWRISRPATPCVPAGTSGAFRFIDDEWSYRCSRQDGAWTHEWSFYVLDRRGRPAPRLERFRAQLPGPAPGSLDAAMAGVARGLTQRYGPAEWPSSVQEFGSAFWRDVHRWQTADLEILLYREELAPKPALIGLLARHRPLAERLAADRRDDGGLSWSERAERELGRVLAQTLGPTHSDFLRTLNDLERARHRGETPSYAEIVPAVVRLLDEADGRAPALQPTLLLAADHLAASLLVEEQDQKWTARRSALARRGLTFEWAPLGVGWVYRRDLLWKVSREFSRTPWGEWAFRLLLQRGWDTSAKCEQGPDRFRTVITEGEQFLAAHPTSPHRVPVLFAVALAYETWWSLSHAAEDEYAEASQYQRGANAARRKSLAAYTSILRLAPGSDEARHVRRVIGRLQLELATHQRAFFCVYD